MAEVQEEKTSKKPRQFPPSHKVTRVLKKRFNDVDDTIHDEPIFENDESIRQVILAIVQEQDASDDRPMKKSLVCKLRTNMIQKGAQFICFSSKRRDV